MDYPVQLASQLPQLLKSLRHARKLTQAELARRLGVVQSRIADIERDPGAVNAHQLLQVLTLLGAQLVVRDMAAQAPPHPPDTAPRAPEARTPTDLSSPDEPRGQW